MSTRLFTFTLAAFALCALGACSSESTGSTTTGSGGSGSGGGATGTGGAATGVGGGTSTGAGGCDATLTCAGALDGDPSALCEGASADLYDKYYACTCEAGGKCEPVCGDNACKDGAKTAECTACLQATDTGCATEFEACSADI